MYTFLLHTFPSLVIIYLINNYTDNKSENNDTLNLEEPHQISMLSPAHLLYPYTPGKREIYFK